MLPVTTAPNPGSSARRASRFPQQLPELPTNWKILETLDPAFIPEIKYIHVFYANTHEDHFDEETSVLLVTRKDNVYALGKNKEGILGVGHKGEIAEPVKIPALCGKRIVAFSTGGFHGLARSDDGIVYAFGLNNHGQLGDGTKSHQPKTPRLVTFKSKHGSRLSGNFVQIDCGCHHSAALDLNGVAFFWGSNTYGQIGCGKTGEPKLKPYEVNFGIRITQIRCGFESSYALLETGEVRAWGSNYCGQLGVGDLEKVHYSPKRVIIPPGNSISCIMTGCRFAMMLSQNGSLFTCGFNGLGQLGLGIKNQDSFPMPTKVTLASEDEDAPSATGIAAHWSSNVSACRTSSGKIQVWGAVRKGTKVLGDIGPRGLLFSPTPTLFESFYEVFNELENGITYRTTHVIIDLERERSDPENSLSAENAMATAIRRFSSLGSLSAGSPALSVSPTPRPQPSIPRPGILVGAGTRQSRVSFALTEDLRPSSAPPPVKQEPYNGDLPAPPLEMTDMQRLFAEFQSLREQNVEILENLKTVREELQLLKMENMRRTSADGGLCPKCIERELKPNGSLDEETFPPIYNH